MPRRKPQPPERALVRRCLAEEAGAWSELQAQYRGPLLEYVRHELHQRGDSALRAEEVAEEVWSALFEKKMHRLRAFDAGRAHLTEFLHALADDQLRQARRKARRRRKIEGDPLPFDLADPHAADPSAADFLERFEAILPPHLRDFYRYELLRRDSPPADWQRPTAANARQLKHRILLKFKEFRLQNGGGVEKS